MTTWREARDKLHADNPRLKDEYDRLGPTYLARIEKGIAEAERGDVVPNAQVMDELRQWRPSTGR